MLVRICLLACSIVLLSCGGADKRLPSSNPPEYDPTKLYSAPAVQPAPATPAATAPAPAKEPELAALPLEPASSERGEWRKLQTVRLQPRKSATTRCEALTQLLQGLGSATLFTGPDGAALKKALGADAESVGRMIDRQLADGLKQAFGPSAAACPDPAMAPPQERSEHRTDAPWILTVATHPLLLAQTAPGAASEDGYSETKSQDKENPPPGWTGWKTINRTSRVGNKPETAGNQKKTTLILGVKTRNCPNSDGEVPGEFEHAMIFYQVTTQGQRTFHIGQRVHAKLTGRVGDDGKLQYVDADAVVVIMHGGSGLSTANRRAHYKFRFTPDRNMPMVPTNIVSQLAETWNFEDAEFADVDLTSTLLASVMAYGGPNMLQAETKWNDPKTGCAEIRFTPVTKQQRAGRSKAVKVRAEVWAKEIPAAVPGQFKFAIEMPEGQGQVSPRQLETKPGSVAQFTYTAPAKTVRNRGFKTGAISRAGAAEGQWEAADIAYVLEFQSRVIGKDLEEPAQSQASGTIKLEPQAAGAAGSEPKYVGQGQIAYQTGPLPNWDVCKPLVKGQGQVPMQVYQAFIHVDDAASGAAGAKGSAKIEIVYALVGLSAETTTGWAYMLNFKCVLNPAEYHPFWSPMYLSGRAEAGTTTEKMWTLKDWTYVGQNGVVATKTLRSTCGGLCAEEVATFTLKEAD